MTDVEKPDKERFTYVEVVDRKTKATVERIDVSGDSDRGIARVERGLNINLNHLDYFSRVAVYDTKQPERP